MPGSFGHCLPADFSEGLSRNSSSNNMLAWLTFWTGRIKLQQGCPASRSRPKIYIILRPKHRKPPRYRKNPRPFQGRGLGGSKIIRICWRWRGSRRLFREMRWSFFCSFVKVFVLGFCDGDDECADESEECECDWHISLLYSWMWLTVVETECEKADGIGEESDDHCEPPFF